MARLIRTAIVVLVITSLVLQVSSMKYTTQNPYSVVIDSTIYVVAKYPESVKISASGKKLCDIAVDRNEDVIGSRMTAEVLWHRIILWGVRSENLINDGKTRQTNYTVLLVDPKRCTYKSIPNLVDEKPNSLQYVQPALLIHRYSFDIFFPSQERCSPCSYDINGEKTPAPEQLKHEVKPGGLFSLKEIGDTSTYVYLCNFENGTAIIRLLDSRFDDLEPERVFIYAPVNQLLVSSGKLGTYVGMTYIFPDKPRQNIFVMFDGKLDIIFQIHLPLLDNYIPIQTLVTIDSKGNSFVTIVQKSQLNKSRKITVVSIDAKGHLIEERDLDNLEENKDYDVQGFLGTNDDYCFVLHELDVNGTTTILC